VVAKKAAGVAGSFAGGVFNNVGVVASIGIVTAIIAGLLIFRKDIQGFFGGLGFPEVNIQLPSLPSFELPTFELPSIELPSFELPTFELPDIGDPLGDVGTAIGDVLGSIGDIIVGGITPGTGDPEDPRDFTESGQAEARARQEDELSFEISQPIGDPIRTTEEAGIISVSEIDEFGIGGGPSFEGGITTFGGGIVDTLTEVLALFSDLTASQARDLLSENPDLTQSEFRLLDPDVINISSFEQEPQDFLQASDPAFSGLTAEQIAFILTGGNISNF